MNHIKQAPAHRAAHSLAWMASTSSALLVVIALAGCQEEPEAAVQVRPVLSVIAAPHAGLASGFAGIVEPRHRTELGFRIAGRVVKRDVEVGSVVTKGQQLAALDPVALELAVRTAEADLASAQARYVNTSATKMRQQRLFERDVVSREEFETAEEAREAADAEVTQAKANLTKVLEQLGYAGIIAESDGVVTAVGAEVGQNVTAGQSVVTVATQDSIEAVVDIPDAAGAPLETGAIFRVALQIRPAIAIKGILREIAPQADPVTRSKRLWISLQSPPDTFRLGTTITATPETAASANVEIPATALFERGGKTMIWAVDPVTSTVALRPVSVGERSASSVLIDAGIELGTRVVIAGVNSLVAGQQVSTDEGAGR